MAGIEDGKVCCIEGRKFPWGYFLIQYSTGAGQEKARGLREHKLLPRSRENKQRRLRGSQGELHHKGILNLPRRFRLLFVGLW